MQLVQVRTGRRRFASQHARLLTHGPMQTFEQLNQTVVSSVGTPAKIEITGEVLVCGAACLLGSLGPTNARNYS